MSGLRQRSPAVPFATVQDANKRGMPDSAVLEWCTATGSILISHDEHDLPKVAWQIIADGRSIPGVVIVPSDTPIASAIADLELIARAGQPMDLRNRVTYLPLR